MKTVSVWITVQVGILTALVFLLGIYLQNRYKVEERCRSYVESICRSLDLRQQSEAREIFAKYLQFVLDEVPGKKILDRAPLAPEVKLRSDSIRYQDGHEVKRFLSRRKRQQYTSNLILLFLASIYTYLTFPHPSSYSDYFVWPGHAKNISLCASLLLFLVTALLIGVVKLLLIGRDRLIVNELDFAIQSVFPGRTLEQWNLSKSNGK